MQAGHSAMPPRIKICGLNTADATRTVAAAPVSFAGFVFHTKSPRFVTPQQAATLATALPAHIRRVAVCVNPDDAQIEAILHSGLVPSFLQLHGNESPERITAIRAQYDIGIIKAIPVAVAADLKATEQYEKVADMLLFDTKSEHPDMPGGTGRSFNWSLLAGFVSPLPWFLSGGLGAHNIGEALRISGATMADISSSLESSPGVKSPQKIWEFFTALAKAP